MNSWWVHDYVQNGMITELISWIFWVLLSITLHELAHGWAAIWQGDDTPRLLNRLTMNPVVHMGPHALIMFAVCGITWGAMPVNPNRFRDGRKGDIYVSAAGPAMNILIGLICTILLVLWLRLCPEDSQVFSPVSIFLYYGIFLNMILAPFNLLPIPPLDGSHILAGLSNKANELFNRPQAQLFGMLVFLAIFFATPIGSYLFGYAELGTMALIDGIGSPLGNPDINDAMYADRIQEIFDQSIHDYLLDNPPAD